MDEMLREYLPILVFLAVAIGLGLVLILAAVVLHPDQSGLPAGFERVRVPLLPGVGGDAFGRVEIGIERAEP